MATSRACPRNRSRIFFRSYLVDRGPFLSPRHSRASANRTSIKSVRQETFTAGAVFLSSGGKQTACRARDEKQRVESVVHSRPCSPDPLESIGLADLPLSRGP